MTSFQAVPVGEGATAAINAINETRQVLGQLLEKTLNLEDAQPWLLRVIASETIPPLDIGFTLATGALTGGVMAAVGAGRAGCQVLATGLLGESCGRNHLASPKDRVLQ